MKNFILGTKVGMTQIFNAEGVLVPVTVLEAGPCSVTQVKTVENDGYSAVQVGFVDKREKLVNKAVKGHFDKAGVSYKRFVREFKLVTKSWISCVLTMMYSFREFTSASTTGNTSAGFSVTSSPVPSLFQAKDLPGA